MPGDFGGVTVCSNTIDYFTLHPNVFDRPKKHTLIHNKLKYGRSYFYTLNASHASSGTRF